MRFDYGVFFVPLNYSQIAPSIVCSHIQPNKRICNRNHVCMDMIHMLPGPYRGFLFSFDLAGLEQCMEWVSLPSHRLVGELSHSIELLFHLEFSALTPTGENIPHYFSQNNGPCSTEAQHKIQSAVFSFPHRNLLTPKTYPTITYFQCFFSLKNLYICSIACARMLDQFTADTHRERAAAVTSSGCAAMQCGKCSKSWPVL